MKVQKNIEVWLVKKRLPRPIDLVQYDTGIQLVFAIQDFAIPGGTTATLYVQKPSGKFVYQETGITVSGNTITIDLENQAITEHGNDVPYQVTMENGTDLITTFAGIMRVEKSLKNANAVESKTVIAAFEAKTAEQLAKIEAETLEQIALVQAASQTEQEVIENKGLEVLNTIPADYTATAALAEKVNREKGSAIVCEAEGEVITVADASDDYVRGLKLCGKTEQVKTTGKNLLDVSHIVGHTLLINNDGKITVNTPSASTAVSTDKTLGTLAPLLEVGSTYILTFDTTGTNKYIYLEDAKHLWTSGNELTITQEMLDSIVLLYASGVSTTAVISNMMIRPASVTDATYEPYTGGAPSPSPDYPQELVSAGASGAINTTVCGKNVSDISVPQNGYYSDSNGSFVPNSVNEIGFLVLNVLPNTTYTVSCNLAIYTIWEDDGINSIRKIWGAGEYNLTFTTRATTKRLKVSLNNTSGVADTTAFKWFMINFGDTAEPYEPYKASQTLTVSTPNGLPGIPVESGGNYTDENGQQWICDEIDFARGVRVKRLHEETYNGSEGWVMEGDSIYLPRRNMGYLPKKSTTVLRCTHFPRLIGTPNITMGGSWGIILHKHNYATLEEWTAWLAQNPITAVYEIETPIETPMSAEELAQYATLHTNKPNTTAFNDSGVHMALEYNADTKLYIDNKFAELAAAIVNNA